MPNIVVPFPDKEDAAWVRGKLNAQGQSARKYPHENAKIILSGFIDAIEAQRFPTPYQKDKQSPLWYAYLIPLQNAIYEVWVIQVEGVAWDELADGETSEKQYQVNIGGRKLVVTESSRNKILALVQLLQTAFEEAEPA